MTAVDFSNIGVITFYVFAVFARVLFRVIQAKAKKKKKVYNALGLNKC